MKREEQSMDTLITECPVCHKCTPYTRTMAFERDVRPFVTVNAAWTVCDECLPGTERLQ